MTADDAIAALLDVLNQETPVLNTTSQRPSPLRASTPADSGLQQRPSSLSLGRRSLNLVVSRTRHCLTRSERDVRRTAVRQRWPTMIWAASSAAAASSSASSPAPPRRPYLQRVLPHGITGDTMSPVLVVLDTSVLVAAWRSRNGASFALLEHLRDGHFEIAVSVPLVIEYEAVLLRHLAKGQRKTHVTAFVDYLCSVARQQPIFFLWRPLLRDADDDMVAEVAVASSADAIVTHNLRDFQPVLRLGPDVLAPAQFLLQLSPR
jgi:putative PIN family toxin of toxin-antitoxin system